MCTFHVLTPRWCPVPPSDSLSHGLLEAPGAFLSSSDISGSSVAIKLSDRSTESQAGIKSICCVESQSLCRALHHLWVSSQLAAVYIPFQTKLHVCIFTFQQREKYYVHLGFTSIVGFTEIVQV